MTKCRKCNYENPKSAKFCDSCGTKLKKEANQQKKQKSKSSFSKIIIGGIVVIILVFILNQLTYLTKREAERTISGDLGATEMQVVADYQYNSELFSPGNVDINGRVYNNNNMAATRVWVRCGYDANSGREGQSLGSETIYLEPIPARSSIPFSMKIQLDRSATIDNPTYSIKCNSWNRPIS